MMQLLSSLPPYLNARRRGAAVASGGTLIWKWSWHNAHCKWAQRRTINLNVFINSGRGSAWMGRVGVCVCVCVCVCVVCVFS